MLIESCVAEGVPFSSRTITKTPHETNGYTTVARRFHGGYEAVTQRLHGCMTSGGAPASDMVGRLCFFASHLLFFRATVGSTAMEVMLSPCTTRRLFPTLGTPFLRPRHLVPTLLFGICGMTIAWYGYAMVTQWTHAT